MTFLPAAGQLLTVASRYEWKTWRCKSLTVPSPDELTYRQVCDDLRKQARQAKREESALAA
jgi:hypothetical protein